MKKTLQTEASATCSD